MINVFLLFIFIKSNGSLYLIFAHVIFSLKTKKVSNEEIAFEDIIMYDVLDALQFFHNFVLESSLKIIRIFLIAHSFIKLDSLA